MSLFYQSYNACVWAPPKCVDCTHLQCTMPSAMRPIQLKISDLARVADVSRFQVDGFLKDVFSEHPLGKKGRGSHRTFTPQELLIFAVAYEIEQTFGVRRSMLALVGEQLRRALAGPRSVNRESRLAVTFLPATATYLEPVDLAREGIVVQLGPLFARVDEYLGVSGPSGNRSPILPLRPVVATSRRSVTARGR